MSLNHEYNNHENNLNQMNDDTNQNNVIKNNENQKKKIAELIKLNLQNKITNLRKNIFNELKLYNELRKRSLKYNQSQENKNKKNSNMSDSVQVNYYTFEDEKLMESSNFVQYLGRNNTNGTNKNNNSINSLKSLNNLEYDNHYSQNINEKIIQKNPCIIIKEPSIFKKKDIDKIIFLQSNIRNYLNNKNIQNDNKDKLKKNKKTLK